MELSLADKVENDDNKNPEVLVKDIVKIFLQDTPFIEDWQRFSDSLDIPRHEIISLQNSYKQGTISSYELLTQLLLKWMMKQSETTKVRSLTKILELNDYTYLHAQMEKRFHPSQQIVSLRPNKSLSTTATKNRVPLLCGKWWPEKKPLVNSFMERQNNGELIVSKIYQHLRSPKSSSKMIKHGLSVTGLGGTGKTTIAKWYGNKYETFYDYILWLDCGEGHLHESFANLAKYLQLIPNRYSLNSNAKDLSTQCFLYLKEFKCLFIYDNAECFVGPEGIKDVLPNFSLFSNFHTLITSRSREWGHETGYGEIQEFHLGLFRKEESVAFLEKNLQLKCQTTEINALAEVLGHFPLALQIAVAYLNQSRRYSQNIINIENFIDKMKRSGFILHDEMIKKLDDYEKTIYETLSISIDKVRQDANTGELAYKILTALAYLQSDNNEFKIFAEMESVSQDKIENAAILLEKYSLITMECYSLSIHRLLQKVLKAKIIVEGVQEEQLAKILRLKSKDLFHYKLIPYMVARKHKNLREDCKLVRNELMETFGSLGNLVRKRRFEEALAFAQLQIDAYNIQCFRYIPRVLKFLISSILRTEIRAYYLSLHNYGVVCYLAGRLKEALDTFECIRSAIVNRLVSFPMTNTSATIFQIHEDITDNEGRNDLITFHSLNLWKIKLNYKLGLNKKADKLLEGLNNVKRDCLNIKGTFSSDLDLHLTQLGVKNTDTLNIISVTIVMMMRQDLNFSYMNSIKDYSLKTIDLSRVKFIDHDGKFLSNIELDKFLPPSCRELRLSEISNEHVFELGKFPASIKRINIESITLSFQQESSFSSDVEELSLKYVQFKGDKDLGNYLMLCENLHTLTLWNIQSSNNNENCILEFRNLPQSIRNLKISEIKINSDSLQHLEVEKLQMYKYSLDVIKDISNVVQCNNMLLIDNPDTSGLSVNSVVSYLSEIIKENKTVIVRHCKGLNAKIFNNYSIKITNDNYSEEEDSKESLERKINSLSTCSFDNGVGNLQLGNEMDEHFL